MTLPTDLILAFDIGTSAVKGALFDEAGTCQFEWTAPYRSRRPRVGWVEQNPHDWLDGMRLVAARIGSHALAGRIVAIGICGQVNTHVFVDAAGAPLRDAIVWQDQRCAAVAADLAERARANHSTFNAPVDASALLSRAEWVRRTEPDVWNATRWILSPKDYCVLALTGATVTDAMTSIGLVDADGRYLDAALALVPELAGRLPPIRPVTQYAGATRIDWLPRTVPVGVGTMDAWAAAVGSGLHRAGDACHIAGTSEVIGILSARDTAGAGIVSFPRFNGLCLHAGPTQAGGDALAWFAAAHGRTLDQVLALAAAPAAADEPVLFLPHLQGERAPLWDPQARAAFIGLSRRHQESDLALAVLRGVALSARQLLEAAERSAGESVRALWISGGASRSDLWCQIKADVMNRTLHRTRNRDGGVFGAARLARHGLGRAIDNDSGPVPIDRTFTPARGSSDTYEPLYSAYLGAYAGLQPVFAGLARIRGQPDDTGSQ